MSDNVPVAILAGGKGTRLSEETKLIPKPMVKIGEQPILWHIMKIYSHYGYRDFVIALGYKGECIRHWFEENLLMVRLEGWNVTCLDTGEETQISGRIRRVLDYTQTTTMLTYGDGLADVNINNLLSFHYIQKKLATVTAVRSPSRFGRIWFADNNQDIIGFDEKPLTEEYINGGFMVLEPQILSIGSLGDDEIFERVYLPRLARKQMLGGFIHHGFWQCMDTIREKELLNELWETDKAPWKIW